MLTVYHSLRVHHLSKLNIKISLFPFEQSKFVFIISMSKKKGTKQKYQTNFKKLEKRQ